MILVDTSVLIDFFKGVKNEMTGMTWAKIRAGLERMILIDILLPGYILKIRSIGSNFQGNM